MDIRKDARIDFRRATDRLLALEVRPQRLGYVVFEGPRSVLDWGVKGYRVDSASGRVILANRISLLLKMYIPSTLVMRLRKRPSGKSRKLVLLAIRTITAEAGRNSTTLQSLNEGIIRSFFAKHDCTTKHQIASRIAALFEELSWRLPKSRKPWDSERSSAVVFDAAATGLAYFNQSPLSS